MEHAVIIIMLGGLPEETILVMNVDKSRCREQANITFEEKCKQKGLTFTDDEMEAWKKAGSSDCLNGNNDYELYIMWPAIINERWIK